VVKKSKVLIANPVAPSAVATEVGSVAPATNSAFADKAASPAVSVPFSVIFAFANSF